MISLRLPLPLSVNALYAPVAKGVMRKTRHYQVWANAAGWYVNAARPKPKRVAGDYILRVWCERPDDRRRDLGNLDKALSDLLVAHQLIDDDSKAVELHYAWRGRGRECLVEITPSPTESTSP